MKYLRFLSSEVVLGTLIAVLSVSTALASYLGAMADSEQSKNELLGMQMLTDANAEYLTANQDIIQDYTYFDNWYINPDPEISAYYQENFSEALTTAMERADYPFDEQYYTDMYEFPNQMFEETDTYFDAGSQWDERGDQLQLVMLVMALGLAFAAWASLLKAESNMRLLFAVFATVTFIMGVVTYLGIPPIAG
jgi:hypothetical protein